MANRKKLKNYGLKLKPIEDGAYLGGTFLELPKEVLREDGQWDEFLPERELQSKQVETQACTAFGSLSACEMYVKRKFNDKRNWSDRWLAWNSDIGPQGADPHQTIETLRKGGSPNEDKWPFEEKIKSWEEFYQTPPANLIEKAREDFLDIYEIKHEYVPIDELKEYLKYSPLGIGVTAWYEKGNSGIYYSPKGLKNNHWCVLFGYDDNLKSWKVFDSYDNYVKLYSYNSLISVAKRFYITKKSPKLNWFTKLVAWLKKIWQ